MTSSLMHRMLLLAFLCGGAVTSSAVGASAPQGGSPQAVDFVAIGADGRPVTDLVPGQISLKVDGKDRAVTSLEFVHFDAPASLLPAPFATNSAADAGRDFVLVIDESTMRIGLEAPLRDALSAFAANLPARDRIGVFTVPRGTTSLAPTADRTLFRNAVATIKGRLSNDQTPVSETATASTSAGGPPATSMGGATSPRPNSGRADQAACQSREVLNTLTSIISGTARPGLPTPVILVSAAMAGPDSSVSGLVEAEQCKLAPRDFQVLGQAADNAHAQIFVVRPEAGTTGKSEGLENVVGVTGGKLLALGRATDDAMAIIAMETSGYYIASFTPEASERNGASHRLELRSLRPEVAIRGRAGLMIPKGERGSPLTPQAMLRTADVQRGFSLRAMAVASRNDGDAKNPVKLVGFAEPADPSVTITAAAAGVYDKTGKLVAQWTSRPDDLQRSPIAAAVVVPAGTYRFRMAAVDMQGRAATADYDVNTEFASAGVAQLGGLLLGTSGKGFMPQLAFSKETEVMTYFELYGRPAGAFGAIVEIAESIDGAAVAAAQPAPAATAIQDKFFFTATLPIASLKPGDYVVRAKITFEGQPTGVLLRTLRKK